MNRRRPSAQTSPIMRVLFAGGILAAGGLLTFAALSYLGFLEPAEVVSKKSREGMVPVPRSVQSIAAFSKVQREDVFSLEQGDDSYYWMPKARVDANPDWILSVGQIVGRVLAKDKREGFVFTEKDFLPEGSRTGLTAGIPEGKQGFFLNTEQVPGLRLLQMGDRFDLLAQIPSEAQSERAAEYGVLAGGIKVRAGKPIPLNGVRILVQSGEIVALTSGRTTSTTGLQGLPQTPTSSRSRTEPAVIQATIAIDSEEVVSLTQALAEGLTIHCIAGSGRIQQAESESTLREAVAQMVSFPGTSRALRAYSKISPEDLAEPTTGQLRRYYFSPDSVEQNWIGSLDQVVGRVLARDVGAGHIFSESDFLPDGTRAGIVGAIPAGMMAIALPADGIRGLGELHHGDRFALMASRQFDLRQHFEGLGASVNVLGSASGGLENRIVNTVLVQEGVLLQSSEGGMVTIAIHPDEISLVTKAIQSNVTILAVARPPIDVVPQTSTSTNEVAIRRQLPVIESDPNPISDVTIFETFIGSERSLQLIVSGSQPEPAENDQLVVQRSEG